MAPGNNFSDPIAAINTGGQRFFMDFLINLKAIPAFGASIDFFKQGSRNIISFLRSDFHFFSGLQTQFKNFYSFEVKEIVKTLIRDFEMRNISFINESLTQFKIY